MLELLKGHNTHDNFRERRNNYEGAKIGTTGTINGPNWHNWNNFCGTVFKGTIGAIIVFVTPQEQIFDHILKFS